MIFHRIRRTFILFALFLVPYNHAAEHNDPLDALLKDKFIAYEDKETSLQKSWRLAKEYGPFATSVALGSYLTYTSMQQQARQIIPELAISGINAYALYKSHTLTKEWLKQLPTKRTFPFQLSLLCATGFATYFCFERLFGPSYIAALSSLILLSTSTFNFIQAHGQQHRQEQNSIDDATINITTIKHNDLLYDDFSKKYHRMTYVTDYEKFYGTLYNYRQSNEKTALQLKNNIVTIMQKPWGSQFIAGLSQNSRHAILKSVGWQIAYSKKDELNMGIQDYPETLTFDSLKESIYASIKKS